MPNHELIKHLGFLNPDARTRVCAFYELLVEENERQNLTRLISPEQFVEGHLQDVLELEKSGLVSFPAMDLGSGGGVPGLLSAVLYGHEWVLCDSEKRKAEFLERAAQTLGLKQVRAIGDRAENALASLSVESVVARAVGPIERILGWIDRCSTWNNLVLLKGPGWEQEWNDLQKSRFRHRYKVTAQHSYSVGAEAKQRVIVRVGRVLRGTLNS